MKKLSIFLIIAGLILATVFTGQNYNGFLLIFSGLLILLFGHVGRKARRIISAVLAIGIVYFIAVEIPIIKGACGDTDADADYLIILGAAIYGETPSLAMVERCDAAIEYLKDNPDLSHFIRKAIDDLSTKINLYDYDLVVMPESSSKVNQYMLRYIYRFAQPMLRQMELVKSLPEKVSFDMDGYEETYLNAKLENGRPRYTEAQKDQVKSTIKDMMDSLFFWGIAKIYRYGNGVAATDWESINEKKKKSNEKNNNAYMSNRGAVNQINIKLKLQTSLI